MMLLRGHCVRRLQGVRLLSSVFAPADVFLPRHIGTPAGPSRNAMLNAVGYASLEDLVDATLPKGIRLPTPLRLDQPLTESQVWVMLLQYFK